MSLFLKRMSFVTGFMLLYFISLNAYLFAQQDDKQVHKAAIFVENRAGRQFDNKIAVFEDFITSRVAEKGFNVISREVVTDSLKTYSPGAAKENRLDTLLSNNTSALRLAQMMNADYLIAASISSFGTEKKKFKGYGVETVNLVTNLRASYKILEGLQGSTLVADTIMASKSERFTERSTVEDDDMMNMLLDESAYRIAESLGSKHIAPPPPKPDFVEITIACGMQDLVQLPVSVPDVLVKEDKTMVVVQNSNLEVQVLDVTVELNGVVIGAAPGVFKAPPGLNKIRLTREGFRDWERTINVYNVQRLKVALQMNEAGYARWKDNTAFLQHLKNGEKLTDANVELIKGGAQMLRQSGFKIDVKADVAKEINSIFELFW
ncbi:hypothetical protein KsCSTR_00820 [Candidatus Kuenenia stuttgartiensis]|uniref:PEGA domain-containing protein n=1 Tax=Kuenenia stuttgartiensis TaxID=174633 RepID=Q1PV60_KUEST|nr:MULTISPECIES: PEGA domain-containing protein [Kuenenia]MBE7546163.1 PEGA domain-containing protein [Planctomycetia bacterium]MBZ0193037.1 PEGA domain-containing protein [Candidatus Kuenenia stuttgartiensis]MCF6152407.1 PEGA domain-containing protein [Candidatus Kuenenia stuttgartiensis]MCL4726591.1 PEGA domain-containing protein [Candidatus Kuenenia stuttgartiensis]MCZ7621472.1 PEGA domain-containing protein [Candidatus Kuenenia sp.]